MPSTVYETRNRRQPVYGPTQFSEADYITGVSVRLAHQLEAALVKRGDIPVTRPLLHRFYDTHRADYEHRPFDQAIADV
ncbi:hypothetical protein ACIRBZ_44920 [Streptomyces sp. NPDC094038]|uniref:hypothetical protein n=1 Tax=Streptomyces sp. NPDC094038 TaxID=3366055 RepID=UPI003830E8A6